MKVEFVCEDSPPEGLLPLALSSVPVDAGDGEALLVEEVVQLVRSLLGLNEHEGATCLENVAFKITIQNTENYPPLV